MTHYHGHRERLRKRFHDAPEKMEDYEILELVLGYVILRRDTKPMAKELMRRFGSLRAVLEAKPQEYDDIPGLGAGAASFIQLLHELVVRHVESPARKREELCTPENVAAMARERLGKLRHEEVWVAYVNTRNLLLAWEKVASGSINNSPINPRDILERALAHKASGFILVHNHPGGDPHPSGADLNLTEQIDRAARQLFIRFIDHVIVSESVCYSLSRDSFL